MKRTQALRDFVRVDDGRIGLIVANDQQGGVFRGHADVWFGDFSGNGTPKVEQLCISEKWKLVERPTGE